MKAKKRSPLAYGCCYFVIKTSKYKLTDFEGIKLL